MWVCACGWWGVHGDRVGVNGESAGGDANLASVDDTNTEGSSTGPMRSICSAPCTNGR